MECVIVCAVCVYMRNILSGKERAVLGMSAMGLNGKCIWIFLEHKKESRLKEAKEGEMRVFIQWFISCKG